MNERFFEDTDWQLWIRKKWIDLCNSMVWRPL